MKKVLLLFQPILFYKIPILNKLETCLANNGFELIIWPTSYEDKNSEITFKHISGVKYNYNNFKNIIREEKIDFIINFLCRRDPGLLFYLRVLFYAKLKSIPIIFYGHGVNLSRRNKLVDFIFNLFYFIYDGIILYTPNEVNKIWSRFHNKITIANNTLDLDGRRQLVTQDINTIKQKYNITEDFIILTTGRLQKRKKIEILFNAFIKYFHNNRKIAWVIVGSELSNELSPKIKQYQNIYYLGPIYDKIKMAEIFHIADLYSIPGSMGLGIIEAMYWGLPILTMDVNHGPEIYYFKNNITGYLASDIKNFEKNLLVLINDSERIMEFSRSASQVYKEEATLEHMFCGFTKQLQRFN